jgi:hypothetical protein
MGTMVGSTSRDLVTITQQSRLQQTLSIPCWAPNWHRATNAQQRVRMQGWRQRRASSNAKPPGRKKKNQLDTIRPSHGRTWPPETRVSGWGLLSCHSLCRWNRSNLCVALTGQGRQNVQPERKSERADRLHILPREWPILDPPENMLVRNFNLMQYTKLLRGAIRLVGSNISFWQKTGPSFFENCETEIIA